MVAQALKMAVKQVVRVMQAERIFPGALRGAEVQQAHEHPALEYRHFHPASQDQQVLLLLYHAVPALSHRKVHDLLPEIRPAHNPAAHLLVVQIPHLAAAHACPHPLLSDLLPEVPRHLPVSWMTPA